MTRPRYGVMPLEERRHVSVTLWCHACGQPTTCTDYDHIWGDCSCGRRCWGTWPKGETAQEGDFSAAPEGVRLF